MSSEASDPVSSVQTKRMSRFHPRLRTESAGSEPPKKPRSHFAELRAAVDIPPPEERVPVPVATVLKKVSEPPPAAVPVRAASSAVVQESPVRPSEGPVEQRAGGSVWRAIAWAFGVLAFSAALLCAMALAYWAGTTSATGPGSTMAVPVQSAALPEDALPEFHEALRIFRDGDTTDAGKRFDALESRFPGAPAIAYVQLLMAMQEGNYPEAEVKAQACLDANFRPSDVLAIRAVMASTGNPPQPEKQRRLLQQAILVDPMNPTPFIELAGLERFLGEDSRAAASLAAAGLRFHPTDSQAVVKILEALVSAPVSGPAEAVVSASGSPERDFRAALGEFRAGRRENGTAILRVLGRTLDPDLFLYILNDPAFRPHLAGSQIGALLGTAQPPPVAGLAPAPPEGL